MQTTTTSKKRLARLNRGYWERNIAAGKCRIHMKRLAVKGDTRCADCVMRARLYQLRVFGLSEQQIEIARLAWEKFNGTCQCCGAKKSWKWCSDHDHKSKTFRGIICYSCNVALGHARDSVQNLQKMIKYLRRAK